jgi:DnaJ like chaperone protein
MVAGLGKHFNKLRDRLRLRSGRARPVFIGKLVGTAVGAFAGWYGALSGFLVGLLVDQLLERRRYTRWLAGFLADPSNHFPHERNPGDAAIAGLAVWLAAFDGGLSDRQAEIVKLFIANRGKGGGEIQSRKGGMDETPLRYARELVEAVYDFSGTIAALPLAGSLVGLPYEERLSIHAMLAEAASADSLGFSAKDAEALDSVGSILDLRPSDMRRERSIRDDSLAEAYRLLGIDPEADEGEVKAVFRKLAAQFHPDANAGLSEEQRKQAEEAFVRIERAYRLVEANYSSSRTT